MKEKIEFTHVNDKGQAHMVDVSNKDSTERIAIAYGEIHMNQEAARGIKEQTIKKGEVLQVARIAGIMAAKRAYEMIPLCHLIALTKCEIDFEWKSEGALSVRCLTKTVGPTGVEMEALSGVSVTLLTIYDMCKAIDREMEISTIHLIEKAGGKSGHFHFTKNDDVAE